MRRPPVWGRSFQQPCLAFLFPSLVFPLCRLEHDSVEYKLLSPILNTREGRVFPWPYIPSNYRLLLFSLPFSRVSHEVDYTRVCFPTSYLPFILKFNPASSLPKGLLSPFRRCLTFCTSNSGVSLGPSSTRIQLPTRCFPWSR